MLLSMAVRAYPESFGYCRMLSGWHVLVNCIQTDPEVVVSEVTTGLVFQARMNVARHPLDDGRQSG